MNCKYTSRSNIANLEKLALAYQLRQLNNLGYGYLKLSKLFGIGKQTIRDLIGNSCLEVDKTEIHTKGYNQHLFNEIYYYVDICRIKQHNLKSHNYGTLEKFPMLLAIADINGKIVYYNLIEAKSENGFSYLASLLSAKLDKSKVIHIDIYSPKLFKILEENNFKFCYVCKKERLKLLGNKDKTPYYQQIEHNFSNIQKEFRRLIKLGYKIKSLEIAEASILLEAVIQSYWFNNLEATTKALASLQLFKQLNIETLEASAKCYIPIPTIKAN